jgi:hypothetical protein
MRRVWQVVTGLAAVALVLVFAMPDTRTAAVWLLLFCAVVGVSVVMVRQPGTFVYVSGDRVGLHTTFGTRYEVKTEIVQVIRVTTLPFVGVATDGLALEAADGKRLLTHANARYDDADLERLGERIGATVASDDAPSDGR